MIGIIQQREIWATESSYLNDPREVAFAAGNLHGLLGAKSEEYHLDSGVRRNLETALSLLDRAYLDPHSRELYREDRSYVASFSRSDESLTLWRTYSGPTGYCVGLDENETLRFLGGSAPESPRPTTWPEYEQFHALEKNFHLVGRIVDVGYGADAVMPLFELILSLAIARETEGMSEWDLREVLAGTARVKHEAFADERETRLIVRELGDFAPDKSVRPSPKGLVSFHRVAIPREAVTSITVAPGADLHSARAGLEALLSDGGRGAWSHVQLRPSEIQFSW